MWAAIKTAGRKTFANFVVIAIVYGAFLNDLAQGLSTKHTRRYFYAATAMVVVTAILFIYQVAKARRSKKADDQID